MSAYEEIILTSDLSASQQQEALDLLTGNRDHTNQEEA